MLLKSALRTLATSSALGLASLLAIANWAGARSVSAPVEPERDPDAPDSRAPEGDRESPSAATARVAPPESFRAEPSSAQDADATAARTLDEAPWLRAPMSPTIDWGNLGPVERDERAAAATVPDRGVTPIEFSPRIGARYSSSGGGYDSFSSVEGFLPIRTDDASLLFLEGNLRLDSDNLTGMTALLGYRSFDPESDRVWGGYIGYDNRHTSYSTFHQLGLGFETLGNIDFRVNGYIPLGQSRNLYRTDGFDMGTQSTSLYFRKNYLLYDTLRMFGETRFYEASLGGFDTELGGRLISFGDDRGLRAYGGIYHYSGQGISPTWGWRARLEANPTDNLTLGAALQQDDLFGTNAIFTVGVNFPGRSSNPKRKDNETYLPRLADSVRRQPTIPVATDTETDVFTEVQTEVIVKNPATGQPWIFQHVTLGATGGDGTFENPFGTVQPALDASLSDGNHIVYVDIGANLDIPGFVIPDRVQVLSRGPVQPLDTVQFGAIAIPLSGTGQFPVIRGATVTSGITSDSLYFNNVPLTGMVALGNTSTLSGFDIRAAGNNGIIGNNVVGSIVRDNFISNAENGIFIQGAEGGTSSATLLRNQIRDSAGTGIYLLSNNNGSIVDTTLSNNAVINAQDDGIVLWVEDGASANNVAIAGNTISGINGAGNSDGIEIGVFNLATASNIRIDGNIISQVRDDGINIGGLQLAAGMPIDGVIISNNTITDVGYASTSACGTGIEVANSDNNARVINNIRFINNQITRAQVASIILDSRIAGTPPASTGGTFNVSNFAGNSSVDPGAADFAIYVHTSAIVNFAGLGNINSAAAFPSIGGVMSTNPGFDNNQRVPKPANMVNCIL